MTEAVSEIRCSECRARNRIPTARLADRPKCGRCKQPLLPDKPIPSTDSMFAEDVLKSPVPVLVDFWAPWCGPCLNIAPVLDRIASDHSGGLKVVKVNVDECPQCAGSYGIRSIPALKLFRDGAVIDELIGAVPRSTIEAMLERHAS